MSADGPLAEIAVAATVAIVVGALLTAPLHPAVVNVVLLVSVGTAMVLYSLIVLRFFEVPPWKDPLNSFLLVFKDEQDFAVILTPIYLLLGIFLPLFLSPNDEPHLYHLAGVAAVGVGDSVAAIYGSLYGTTKWPRSKKTVEGSAAMAGSIVVFLALARPFCAAPVPSYLVIIFTALILAAIEAFTVRIDNIALPVVGYLLLH
ncbi:phosphatidate cytidylyltransferase [Ancylostoma duodenale]|uniref:dolichol kinase n=1 Tax=Ancylostoma duodenale TaxID=51022 RepID=A0A0C2GQV1_9BILA|nr:phosphatidate cytidylyltransferase [Ancylostoma duodenale]